MFMLKTKAYMNARQKENFRNKSIKPLVGDNVNGGHY